MRKAERQAVQAGATAFEQCVHKDVTTHRQATTIDTVSGAPRFIAEVACPGGANGDASDRQKGPQKARQQLAESAGRICIGCEFSSMSRLGYLERQAQEAELELELLGKQNRVRELRTAIAERLDQGQLQSAPSDGRPVLEQALSPVDQAIEPDQG